MPEIHWLDRREQRAWRAFNDMTRRLGSTLGRRLTQESGLSAADYEVLVVLSEAPDRRLRARDLARLVEWEKSRLSHHIGRMQQRGLVERQECPTDARGAFVQLSEQGLHAIQAAAPDHVEAVRRHFVDLLEPAELDLLASIADRVLANLDRPTDPCGEE
jgi:DNA-binding MarR family transcriptional regulator